VENFYLGLELLRSLGFWENWAHNSAPMWDMDFLSLPVYFRACSEETVKRLESLGFSWGTTGMLRYPVKEGRFI